MDDVLVPSVYKAIATYSDKAYYSAATGYVTTADYAGTVECQEISSVTYTVVYTGDEADSHGLTVTGAWLYVVAGLLIVAAAGTVVYVLRCRNPKGSTIRKGVSRKECER